MYFFLQLNIIYLKQSQGMPITAAAIASTTTPATTTTTTTGVNSVDPLEDAGADLLMSSRVSVSEASGGVMRQRETKTSQTKISC